MPSMTSRRVPMTSRIDPIADSPPVISSALSEAAVPPSVGTGHGWGWWRGSAPSTSSRYCCSASEAWVPIYAGGKSRVVAGSSESIIGIICSASEPSSARTWGDSRTAYRPSRRRRIGEVKDISRPRPEGRSSSSRLFHGGPQPVLMETINIELGPITGARRHHGPTLHVDIHHQLGRLLLRVAEQLLKDERHERHQVDRIVPDDHHPRSVRRRRLVGGGTDVSCRNGLHVGQLAPTSAVAGLRGAAGPVPCTAVSGRSAVTSGAWTDIWWWNQITVAHTTDAPSTWVPTRTEGRWVKNWVYPMIPWANITTSTTRPALCTDAGASLRQSIQSSTSNTTTAVTTISA